jgi:glyoxylase-like metal-dependent hydrolase (beta-lactamase superfamily II)
VDAVLVTHMHADHVGGLMVGDKMVFPNATVPADKHDADFWLSRPTRTKGRPMPRTFSRARWRR